MNVKVQWFLIIHPVRLKEVISGDRMTSITSGIKIKSCLPLWDRYPLIVCLVSHCGVT